MESPKPPKESERRRSSRATVSRPVLFTGARGEGLLRPGQAVDISAGGILIHTPQPELMGRHLDLELHPEGALESGDVIMVKGEVVRVDPLSGGTEYAMGVRFLHHVPATEYTGARLRPATRQEAEDLAGSIQRQLDALEPAVRLDVSGAARVAAAKQAGKGATAKSSRAGAQENSKSRRWWRGLFLGLLLLLLLVSLLVPLVWGMLWGINTFRTRSTVDVPEAPREPITLTEPEDSGPNLLDQRLAQIESEGPAYYINRGSFLLVQGKLPAAAQAFETALKSPTLTPVERFVAQLGEAQALASDGRTEEAVTLLEAPFAEHEYVPEPWLALKASFLEALYNRPESLEAQMPLVNAFTFEAGNSAGGPGGPAGGDGAGDPEALRIEVDTNRHLLTVLENNRIRAVYPVGLGVDGRTPSGQFAIANKIKNPDWYNRGAVIKAGDPENELGSRWLGLADEAGPTPLGIHGTRDETSIGANLSRGCIRMRPADVEELFSIVDVGTPVHIRAL